MKSEVDNKKRMIKCVVWDLDDTLWEGTMIEGDELTVRSEVKRVIETLDQRGILQSLASKNDHEQAVDFIEKFGLKSYFLFPQINWSAKSGSIKRIAEQLNIGLDSIAFIDDQEFEREEVKRSLPEVMCLPADCISSVITMPEFIPEKITDEAKNRRAMYLAEQTRKEVEQNFSGAPEEFLAHLGMKVSIYRARETDLERSEELVRRTNQFNTTGYSYSLDELNYFRTSSNHRLYVVDLEDRFGSYGVVGLGLLECYDNVWRIKLLLMSCRVVSRGIGTVFLNYIMCLAKDSNKRLLAEILPNDRNRLMRVSYGFSGFREVYREGDVFVLENDLSRMQEFPWYLEMTMEDSVRDIVSGL